MLMVTLNTDTETEVKAFAEKYSPYASTDVQAMMDFRMASLSYGEDLTSCCAAYHAVGHEKAAKSVEFSTPMMGAGGGSMGDADRLLFDMHLLRKQFTSMSEKKGTNAEELLNI